jgi:hypothetical protein
MPTRNYVLREAIIDKPFQSQIEETRELRQPDSKARVELGTGAFYRDREGREREEMYTSASSNTVAGTGTIYDPVAKVEYYFELRTKNILNTEVFQDIPGTQSFRCRSIGIRPAYSIPRTRPLFEPDLGSKEIEGLTCRGYTLSRREDGKVEYWYSEDLDDLIFIKLTRRSEQITWRLFNISRTEPPRHLFSISP